MPNIRRRGGGEAALTSRELAKRLGISQSTISRAFSPHASISPETREWVMAAAREHGYQPNVIARTLSTRSSNMVGIVMADMTNPFYPVMLEKMAKAFQREGLQILLFTVPPGEEIDRTLPLLQQYLVDAIVVASATISSEVAQSWAAGGRPAVLINRSIPGAQVTSVATDNAAGARQVAEFLADRGHRRMAFVDGPANTSTNRDRRQGFLDGLAERGLALHAEIDAGEYSYEAGRAAVRRLIDARPDAIFFANDILALGGLDTLRHELKLNVPGDISVVGFDDIPMADWPSFRLTTVAQPMDDMVEATVRYVRVVLDGGEMRFDTSRLPGRLVVRDSVGRRA